MSALRYRHFLAVTMLIGGLIAALMLWSHAANAVQPDPVMAAWEKARAAGSYYFDSDIVQVTIPSAKITNVGRSSRTERLHLKGQSDLRNNTMEMHLWSEGGSILQGENAVAVKIENGKAVARQGMGHWQEVDNFADAVAPQGDFMAYLVALRDVTAHPPESRNGIDFTRYSFQIDGARFAVYARDQIEAAMRSRGELPPGVHIDVPRYYRDMAGEGELWIGASGLPLRQILTLSFPEQNDESINAQITVDFSNFAAPPIRPIERLRSGDLLGFVGTLSQALPNLTGLFVLLPLLSAMMLVMRYRRARTMQHVLAVVVIGSMVIGPLLSTGQIVSFADAQTAKAATQAEARTESRMAHDLRSLDAVPEFNPHADPLAAEARTLGHAQMAGLTAAMHLPTAPAALLVDNGVDSDDDGLSDFAEERVGTDPNYADSDEDIIPDNLEVHGFQLGGQTWYANPLDIDSNRDGIADTLEWDNNGDGQPDDTDGDGVPDLFDSDNDNDGVPDSKDMAPFTRVQPAGGFGESNPFQLTIHNLTAGKPTFVDFQVRPHDEQHLWFALSVLDWPQDGAGQVQDIDGNTYADFAAAQGRAAAANESFGDMKLLPMLEIRIQGETTNLAPQADLAAYGVSVSDYTADTKVAYVPLSIVTDEKTGQRVAFNGRMRYQPAGAWPSPHQVRLVWVVQALQDVPCEAGREGCGTDGYIHNVPQVIQSYYDAFTLTGLNVREDQGNAGVAIIYEDPVVDDNLKDDAPLWTLSHGLDNSFLAARDQDNNGQRDLDLDEIVRRFDRLGNSSVADTERWAIANGLRVEHQVYDTFDQAMIFTAMTETKRILDNTFTDPWHSDNTLKPLLMYAHEARARALGLDGDIAGGGYVATSSNGVTLDMAPTGQPPIAVDVTTGLKWTPYCAPAAASPLWDACAADDYWDELAQRHAAGAVQPGDPGDPDIAAGRLIVTQLYALSLMQSIQRVVQRDNQLVSSRYTLKSDTDLEGYTRLLGTGTAAAVPAVANIAIMARFVEKISVLKYLKEFTGASAIRAGKSIAKVFRTFTTGGHLNRLAGTGIVVAGAALIAGLGTLAYYFSEGELGAKITLKVITISLTTFLSVISPILTVKEIATTFPSLGIGKLLLGSTEIVGSARAAGVIGAVIGVAITWGFFIYSMVSNNVSAFSPEFNRALAETIAATIYLIFLAVLSATVIGGIIVGIVAAIDGILTAICELGVDELRTVPGLGGACFTIGTSAIKGLAYLLYNYELMVDTDRKDLVVTGSPAVTLADSSKGFIPQNALSIGLPVTTTVVHKDPSIEDSWMIFPYIWLFSPDNLKSSTVRTSLTAPNAQEIAVERYQMTNEWQDVREDHKFLLSPMYRAQASPAMTPVTGFGLQAGLNRRTPFYLNLGYALPAYECWGVPNVIIPFVPPVIPVCYTRDLAGKDSTKIDEMVFDIFPDTLGEFLTLSAKADGGQGLSWDAAFPSLFDADGDGLRATIHGGIDPNDASPDSDGDGLTDAYELERRAAGVGYEPGLRDTDGDGLTDLQEMQLGTNPAVADSDNDGLLDGEEVWHQVDDPNTGEPTNTWTGGWDVTINAATPFTVRVSSDPNHADTDGDGVGDLAERTFALDPDPASRLDNQNRPYHPGVANTPPLAVYTSVDDTDGFVHPGQSVRYTTTVVANTPLAPGVLNVTLPSALGSSPAPYALPFDPLTFNTSETVTHQTALVIASVPGAQTLAIESTANTRLPGTGAGWAWAAPTTETALGNLDGKAPRFIRGMPAATDRQDSYRLVGQSSTQSLPDGAGDVWSFDIPSGSARKLELDTDTTTSPPRLDNAALRGASSPALACNSDGVCMAVWSEYGQCSTVTINSLRVGSAGDDHGTSGIEPVIFFAPDGDDYDPTNGGYELLWIPAVAGLGNDMVAGNSVGPNAGGFPITRTFCDRARLEVYETDGISFPENNTDWGAQARIDHGVDLFGSTGNVSLASDGHEIILNISVADVKRRRIAAALIGPDGQIQRTQFAVTAPTGDDDGNSNPVIASDGSNFLVAWQRLHTYQRQLLPNQSALAFGTELMTRLFDAAGNALTGETMLPNDRLEVYGKDQGAYGLETLNRLWSRRERLNDLSLTWIGIGYVLSRQLILGAAAGRDDLEVEEDGNTFANPNQITLRQIDVNGAHVAGSKTPVTQEAIIDERGGQSLVYDPANRRLVVVFHERFFDGVEAVTARLLDARDLSLSFINSKSLGIGNARNVDIVYHPPSLGYMVTWTDTASQQLRYQAFNSGLDPLISATPQSYSWPVAVNPEVGGALACPASQSAAKVDLRFEELPGAITFADSSGHNHESSCIGPLACPAAGVPGAPNAPLSDYALQFDGDDWVEVPHAEADDFTFAVWIKPVANPNNVEIIADQGVHEANGWALSLQNGAPSLEIGPAQSLTSPLRVDDGQWHFVVATRQRATGEVAIYVDGALVATSTLSTAALTAKSFMRLAVDFADSRYYTGAMDHLQIFSVALSGSTVQALYNRTLQSYCVAAGVPTTGNAFPWTRLTLHQPDGRGGRISASDGLTITVDTDAPASNLTSLQNSATILGNGTLIIGGAASDPTSGIALVEVSVNDGPWQVASGANSWTFPLQVTEGDLTIRTRATDVVGNVETPGAGITVQADATAPQVMINAIPATPVVPIRNANGQWTVTLGGTAADAGSSVDTIEVHLHGASGPVQAHGWQAAARNGDNWTISYALDAALPDPTGVYTVTVRAADGVGNRTPNNAASAVLPLDSAAPIATLSQSDLLRQVITQTVTLSGLVTDTNSVAGLDTVEIAFTPVEAVAALPAGLTSDEAEGQLNRTWHNVTLVQRGAGVAHSSWSFPLPAGLEGEYQIDLRTADLLGNRQITANLWRGLIDNLAPRLAMTATASGASYVDPASSITRYEIRYLCAAVDRNLSEADFTCPGEGLQLPVRSFDNDPVLQSLFPDRTIRSGLAISYTLWEESQQPFAAMSACDTLGLCASASTPASDTRQVVASREPAAVTAAAAPGEPQAVVVAPTAGSFVAANDTVNVTVAAEAGASLQEVTIKLDNVVVQTLNFTQAEARQRILRTVDVAITGEGPHTLSAQAVDWAGATQTTHFPVAFMLDTTAPTLTIDAGPLTTADTWQPESGILRFNGTADDGVGLAAVQIREGDNPFTDVTFGGGTWQTALPVQDPEGRTLAITVRAIDRSGRITEITQPIATELSAPDAPDTTIISGPDDPSSGHTVSFVFAGSVSSVAFNCQLNDGLYTPCTSPWTVTDLSKGTQIFRVRAIDGRGFADLTPASFTWTVAAGQPDATMAERPTDPTTKRSATFTFGGDATAEGFECSLDGTAFTACTSPQTYSGLRNGVHTFLVRARDAAGNTGAADRYTWTVLNAAPTVVDQLLTVVENGALAITLQGSDDDALTYQVVDLPQHGVMVGLAPNLTYVPNTDYAGPDRFTYRAWDGDAYSTLATVQMTVRLGKYAVFAQEGVAFKQNSAVVRGDVGVNVQSDGAFLSDHVEASFAQNAKMQDPNSQVLADSIMVNNNAVVYNPSYNDLTGKGEVNGTRTTPLAIPLRTGLPELSAITPGTQNVDVSQNGSQTLAPGSYGELNAAEGTTIVFTGGIYHFAAWNVGDSANLHFAAPSEVRIAGAVVVGDSGYVGPAPGIANLDANGIVIQVAGTNGQGNSPSAVDFAQNATVVAYIVAPNGLIHFHQNVDATGAFIAKWVLVDQNASVTRPHELEVAGVAGASSAGEAAVEDTTETETPILETPATDPSVAAGIYLPVVTAAAALPIAAAPEDISTDTMTDGAETQGEAQSFVPNDETMVNSIYLPLVAADK